MNLKVISIDGELSASFLDNHLEIAKQYADMYNGKVIEVETGEVLYDACRCKNQKTK